MQYTGYHFHSDLSSGVTNIDSVTKFKDYIEYAKSIGMQSFGFSEHGSVFEWVHKKQAIEEAGMKYIHAAEVYLTEDSDNDNKHRDNYHCVLIAKDYDGVKELNKLISKSFCRSDFHFYYVPRISFKELYSTSDNIIITTACIGGVFGKGNNTVKKSFLQFLVKNKHRSYLEIQHHNCDSQKQYNQMLYEIHKKTSVPLIAGTDTHCLNTFHAEGRKVLQKAKKVYFSDEDQFDLTFKTYDELVESYRKQASLPISDCLDAIENTNVMASMIEPFTLDTDTKYPKIYSNSDTTFKEKVVSSTKSHKYALKNHDKNAIKKVVQNEFEVYKKTRSIDFMLLQKYLRDWEHENNIYCGYGRGSVSGSEIAYLLGVTDMDSLKFGLNFFRFLNPSRITNADIDTDYSSADRDKVKEFILKDHMNLSNIQTSEIITFNTIALKGAIKDIGRALGMSIDETQRISDMVYLDENKKFTIDNKIREKHPELFKYVDLVNGVIVSIGSHPSGVLISDRNIDEEIGLCSLGSSPYPVSMLNMKELDYLMYVKLDILGLDNIGVINETCKLAGIERLTPDNTDLDDENVWRSIRDDTTMIFQWESESAQSYLKKFMSDETIQIAKEHNPNFSYIKWFSFGNGLIRPGCASFRDSVANGEIVTTSFKELNAFLSTTFGRIVMQEDIMQFLVKFCGYSDAESDTVRRCVDEDTLVLMGNGSYKKIKDIRCGDIVLTIDNNDNALDFKPVKNVFYNGIRETYKIKGQNGYELIATKDHKVLTQNGWKQICDLTENDFLVSLKMTSIIILWEWIEIESIEYVGERNVYDIEVKDNHNYIANGIVVHNCIAKKYGTEGVIDEIHDRFVEYSNNKYDQPKKVLEEIFPPIKQGILDATRYAFSWNHSDAYSCIGYICGYLRYYYPLEFITSSLNIFQDNQEKSSNIIRYARKQGIKLESIKFGKSSAGYAMDRESNSVFQGVESIKYCNSKIAEELLELSKKKKYDSFIDLLDDINEKTSVDNRQLRILTGLNFFSDFGNNKYLLNIINLYNGIKEKDSKTKKQKVILPPIRTCSQISKSKIESYEKYGLNDYILKKHSKKETAKQYGDIDNIGLLNELISKIPNNHMSIQEQVKFEIEYLQYTSFKDESIDDSYYIVIEYNTYKSQTKPYITLRNLNNGEEINSRIKDSNVYKRNPFGKFSVLKVDGFAEDFKKKYIDGKWKSTSERETIVEYYEVIKR